MGGSGGAYPPRGEALDGGCGGRSPPPRMMMCPLGDQWIGKFEDLLGKTPNPGGSSQGGSASSEGAMYPGGVAVISALGGGKWVGTTKPHTPHDPPRRVGGFPFVAEVGEGNHYVFMVWAIERA